MSEADPSRIVADADVLVADLFVGGPAREALDLIRKHDWLTLVASEQLLADAKAVITDLADPELATAWARKIETERLSVSHPEGDHPALAAAYHGDAAHILTLDDALSSAAANRSLQGRMAVSIRTPDAFVRLFDPESLYESLHDGAYDGPDRDPRV